MDENLQDVPQTETVETTTETVMTEAPTYVDRPEGDPSTPAQDVVEEVHGNQAGVPTTQETTTTTSVHEVTDDRAGRDQELEDQRQAELNEEREHHNAERVQQGD